MEWRDLYLPSLIWILPFCCFSSIVGSANPEPHPNPASPLTGPGVHPPSPNPRITLHPEDQYFARNDPARLNCQAEGDPTPNITWYKDGKKLEVGDHQMILPGGLFFLRFIHTKNNKPDVGVYFCKATNIHGTAVSRNATIKVAVLRDDFRQEPIDTTKSAHSTAIFHCKPPRGEPEPRVAWLHNGKPVTLNERIKVHADGDLVISLVKTQDSGEYVCLAKNIAGERQSSPAELTVLEKPSITRYPETVTADEGQTVEFHCDYTGDATTKMRWEKDGERNQQKWTEIDKMLRITNIEAGDAGTYTCIAENDAGMARAVGHLHVEYTPRFLVRPRDQTVAAGRTVTLQCSAVGNPLPTTFWKLKSQADLLFQNKNKGRFFVAEDGTLRIEKVQKSDEGTYSCHSLNTKGEAQVSAYITVREHDFRPPPVIRFAPQNQTLGQDGNALLRCQAIGSPKPTIRWYKHGRPLQMDNARYTLLNSGTLQISSLKVADTGSYSCNAVSETGETTAKAYLTVRSQPLKDSESDIGPPDISRLPGPPEKPVISDVTDTSLRLSWEQRFDGVDSYQVEYFAYGYSETWETIGKRFTDTDVEITGLVPNTTYIFLVRSVNSNGIGGPSHLSDLIRTLEKQVPNYPKPVINLPRQTVKTRIQEVEVRLVKGEAVNASAIRVVWQVPDEYDVVDGFVIQYRHIQNMGDRNKQRYGEMQRRTLPYRPLYYTIGALQSYEYYEICVMASSSDLVSPCSQPMKIQSGESVPSSPPVNIILRRESDTQILLEWSPPDIEERKGEIVAYQIRCFSEDGSHNCSRSTNGTTTSLRIEHLISGVNYNIEMAALTEKGVGKWSSVYSVGPQQVDITKEAWFIGLIVAIGSVLWLALCIFTIWLCRNKKRQKKLKEQEWYSTGTTRSLQKNPDRNGSVVRKGYGVKDGSFQTSTDSGLPPEFSTLLTQNRPEEEQGESMYNHPEMKTFYQKSGPVTPYATTTLLQAQNARKQSSEQMFRPINQGYHQQSGGSGDSNTDRSNTTDVSIESRDHTMGSGDSGHMSDENGMLLKQYRKGCRPGVPNNQANINWTDVLPPPPTHPPSDTEYLQEDQLYSEIPEERARSPMSPVSISQMSACSCPAAHGHQHPGYSVQMYDSQCNPCNSLRNFDNRPYSPQQILQLQRQHGYIPNASRTLGNPHHQHSLNTQLGGAPIYLQGYSQPWDCRPLPRGPFEYDYSQLPRSEGYNYTEPIQDGLIEHGTLKGRDKNKNIPAHYGPHIGDYYPRDIPEIPGGPPGNYCEGPCRSQIEALNNAKNSFNMVDSDNLPCFEGYKIVESPPSSASEYKVIGEAGSQSGDSGKGDRRLGVKGRSASEGNDLRDRHLTMPKMYSDGLENHLRPQLYHSRSETSRPGHSMIPRDETRNTESPISEGPDYAGESENCVERSNERGNAQSCQSTNTIPRDETRNMESPISEGPDYAGESENCVEHSNERDSMLANWESMEDCSSEHSSSSHASEGSGGQFLNEEDFASAVARAAELSGLMVEGTTVSSPSHKPVKKTKRHHRQARPPSPGYSTDSNYGTADLAHKSYPKSRRRKSNNDHGKSQSKGDHSTNTTNMGDDSNMDQMDQSTPTSSQNAPSTSSKPVPSLYKSKPLEGTAPSNNSQSQRSPEKVGMFKFSEDIPVV